VLGVSDLKSTPSDSENRVFIIYMRCEESVHDLMLYTLALVPWTPPLSHRQRPAEVDAVKLPLPLLLVEVVRRTKIPYTNIFFYTLDNIRAPPPLVVVGSLGRLGRRRIFC